MTENELTRHIAAGEIAAKTALLDVVDQNIDREWQTGAVTMISIGIGAAAVHAACQENNRTVQTMTMNLLRELLLPEIERLEKLTGEKLR